jgi:D-alanyl-D-alanine dipeptidase
MSFDHKSRLEHAGQATADAGLDGLIVAPGPDLVYLIGYDPPPLERLTALLVRPDARPVLMVPELERPRAEAAGAADLAEIQIWRDGDSMYGPAGAWLQDATRFGVSDRLWAVHLLGLLRAVPHMEFEPASPVLSTLRMRKDDEELQLLARTGRCADEAFRRITAERVEGRTEAHVARALSQHLLDAGCEAVAFCIVAAGSNGASPHHEPADRPIRRGDAVVLDFGGWVGGYASDTTRTVVVGGPSEEQREVHAIVREAQEAAFAAAVPGVPAEEVDRAARRVVEDAGYGETFFHRTGHGIGLEEHEDPYIVEGNRQVLEPGMTFSIEPGIYLEGRFGVRIEDIVAMTEDGAVRYNNTPRELLVVG